ncbi:MAG: TonB-dependent receptor plug domain-containing protein [Marinirhabdus sp.]|nr:TonB-dependent receptor plug domain-containing protein [Marinirhabdus sp.]
MLLFVVCSGVAQPSQESRPLLKVLKEVEQVFDVKFSYNRRDLKSITVDSFVLPTTLASALEQLSAKENLVFTRIKERYIAIQVKEEQPITVCGILIETETSIPIEDAEIVSNSDWVNSDGGGNFTLTTTKLNMPLSIFVNGFLVRKMLPSELQNTGQCPFIYISQTYTFLPEVVLKNYITKGISKDISGATTIDNDNFEILPNLIEPDVLQIAQVLPGITSADETAANLNVRGGTADELLILWDDVRMYQTGHFFGLISAFNPNLTQKVRLFKNGTDSRYGEGVSGVLAMESSQSIPEEFKGGVGVNLTSANGYAEIPVSENFLITLSGRTAINTGIGNPVYNEFFNKVFQNTVITNFQTNAIEGRRSTDEEFNFFDISTKVLWKLSPKDQLSYQFLIIDNRLKFSERFIAVETGSLTESELKQQSYTNKASYLRNWSRNLSSEIALSSTNYQRNAFSNARDLNLLDSNQNEVIENALKIDLQYKTDNIGLWAAGFQYTDTQITDARQVFFNTEVRTEVNSLYSNAAFVSNSLSLFNGTTKVTSGARLTHYPKLSESFVEPRLHVDQKISAKVRAFLSGELKHQSVYQRINIRNTLLGVETSDWLLANSEDSPFLQSKQLGLGASFKESNWTFSSNLYIKEVSGIKTSNLGFQNQLHGTDFEGEYTIKGLEFSVNRQAEHWNFWLSYSFQDNNFTFSDFQPQSFRNNLESEHSATLAASYSLKNFQFSLGNTIKSGLPYTTPVAGNEISTGEDGNTVNFNTPNNAQLPVYFRSDFSASYEWEVDESLAAKVHIAFLNLLNRKNILDQTYRLEDNESGFPALVQINQLSLGFTPNISFQLLF